TTDNGDGTYTATLTGTVPGTAHVSVMAGGVRMAGQGTAVTLAALPADAAKSTLTRAPDTIPADGTTASTLTLTLHDAQDHPVKGQTVQFMSDLTGSAAGAATDNGDGTYTAKLTGTVPGTAHVSVMAGGVKITGPGAAVTLTALPADATKSALTRAPDTIPADGTTASTLTLTLHDTLDHPVKGQTVQFMSDLTGSAAGTTTDNGDGTYTAKLTGTVPGTAHISVIADGVKMTGLGTAVTLAALPPLPGKSSLDRDKDTILADGTDKSTLTLTLHDTLDHPVKGQTVVFVTDKGTVGATTDNHDGTYTAALTAAPGVTGTADITVKVGGNAFGTLKTTVTLTALPPLPGKSSLDRDKDTILADGTDKSTLTLTLHDTLDHPVKGQTVVFVSDKGTVGATTDNHDGTYTAALTAAPGVTGTANITVKVGGNAFGTLKTTVALTALPPLPGKSALDRSPDTIPADGTTASTLKLTLHDSLDHPVKGQTIEFVADKGTVGATTDNGDGTYTAALTAAPGVTGTANISVKVGGNAFGSLKTTVALAALPPDAAKSTLGRDKDTIPADGTTASTLKLTLHDTLGNPVKGQTVVFVADRGTAGATTDNHDGTYTAVLTAAPGVTGTANITVKVGGNAFGSLKTTVALAALPPLPGKSSLDRDKDTIPADGTTASTLKLTLHDALDHPVKGQTIEFVADKGTVGATTDNHDGTYTAALTAAAGVTGTANISVKVGGNAFGTLKTTVTLTALPPLPGKSSLDRSPDTIPADGTTASTLTLSLHDTLDHPVKGQTVVFVSDKGTVGATTDNHDGTYTAALTAAPGVTGTANITVKVAGSAFGTLKTTVALTALPPDATKSVLDRDKAGILADGADKSTLKLKLNDALGHPVKGQTVEFVTDKGTVGATTDNHDGTYTAALTAAPGVTGTANITVKVGGSDFGAGTLKTTVEVKTATPDMAKSGIKLDNTTYVAGTDMGVTVTLHDALDVGVAGAAGSLSATAVTVPGAVMKAGTHWNDEGGGTYTATYTATSVVTGQKAGLKLSSWSNAAESDRTYDITAAPADATKSTLGRDKDTILADGTDKSTLKLKLHDALDQPMNGQTVEFVTDKGTAGTTTDNHDGTYTAALTAAAGTAAGTAHITVKVGGTPLSAGTLKTTVEVKTATPDMAKSGIKLDNTTYVAGTDMGVTVTLHDALDVGVAGAVGSLSTTTVTVPGAVMKAGTHWNDEGGGTYTATYTATSAVSGQKAGLKLSGWTGAAESAAYDIAIPKIVSVYAAGTYFPVNAGFPSTGYLGGDFSLTLTVPASNYRWQGNPSWMELDAYGNSLVVTLKNVGSGDLITIVGTPTNGIGSQLTYTVKLKKWFSVDSAAEVTYNQARNYCSGKGASVASLKELTLSIGGGAFSHTVGGLWSEWGKPHMANVFTGAHFWTSTEWPDGGAHKHQTIISLDDGRESPLDNISDKAAVICVKAF
ncbi:Ig-like domain-containing protein, partial [Enterobacter bugandensis]|uniref:invasin domain 3-containing protein n=1 Tax=Enterobacter bugandensis TaxID=881260 RepID=UPI002003C611